MPEITSPLNTTQSTPKLRINWLHILIGVIIGVVLLGAGFGVYFLTQPKSESTNEPIKVSTPSAKQATPSATATPSADKDETADWKTFTYENPKISFKYPKSWFINVEPEINNEGNFTVSISSYNPTSIKNYPSDLPKKWILLEIFVSKKATTSGGENSKLYDFISSQALNVQVEKDKFYLIKTKSFKLDSYSAVRYTSEPTLDAGTEYYFRDNILINKGSLIWKVSILSPDKNHVKQSSEVFDQIISTFKFLD